MNNLRRKIVSVLMASALFATGCADTTGRRDRNEDIEFNTSFDYSELDHCSYNEDSFSSDYNAYTFNLMSAVLSSESRDTNVLISPASIMFALDLTAAGANGNTLTEITDLFSEGADPLEQQAFAASMMDSINSSEDVIFSSANAIWTNDDRMSSGLNPDYQEYVEEYFDAEAIQESFSIDTVNEINSWIEDHTNGMIDEVLQELEPEAIAVLVNAIAFEGEWASPYEDYQVSEMPFTTSTGEEIDVDMLSDTSYYYYESDKATGFIRNYEGGQYAFLVMLPVDEHISANEFLSDFSIEDYEEFINSKTSEYEVYTRIPEFDYDYTSFLNDTLISLGVRDAFDEDNADFSGIGFADSGNNIYIGEVIHKTHIEVDRDGTRAAAATVIVMDEAAACPLDEDLIRYVYCDRPFAYAIVNTDTMNPIFVGTFNG